MFNCALRFGDKYFIFIAGAIDFVQTGFEGGSKIIPPIHFRILFVVDVSLCDMAHRCFVQRDIWCFQYFVTCTEQRQAVSCGCY